MPSAELDFTHRAHLSEWMDEPCSYADFRDCLRSLAQVNAVTLAYRPTLQWLRGFPPTLPLHIVDVGCGGGDMLRHIERWAKREMRQVRLTGVDLNPYAARAAREITPASSRIVWLTGDAFSATLPAPADVVISSLFTHHLEEAEIVKFLRWMEENLRAGMVLSTTFIAEPCPTMLSASWPKRRAGIGLCAMMARCLSGGLFAKTIGGACCALREWLKPISGWIAFALPACAFSRVKP